MVLLKSTDIPLGTAAPAFRLASVDGKTYALEDFSEAKALVVMFLCAHCPYVQAVEDRIVALNRDYRARSVQFVGICSNDPTDYPEDRPEALRKRAEEKGYGFPYLVDETQQVAKDYGAVCTPELYVFDADRKLAYHGRIDDSWQDASKVKVQDLRRALDRLLAGERPEAEQLPSMGCSIKWKK